MNFHRYSLVFATCILATSTAYSSTEVTTRVVSAGTYSNGNVYVLFEGQVDETGCTRNAIELPANAVNAKSVLATAFLALATGKAVVVRTNICFMSNPSFDASVRNAYFGMAN